MASGDADSPVVLWLETIFGSEEDRFKAAASLIEDSAHRAIEEQDRQAVSQKRETRSHDAPALDAVHRAIAEGDQLRAAPARRRRRRGRHPRAEDQLVAAMKAEEARAALYAKRDQLIEEQLRAKFKYGRLGSGEVA